MHNVKKKGFTLIELIAVLVIMAIIALIATPLVISIIRKARVSADRRSIDAYGRSIELAIASYLLDTGKFPTEVSQLTIEYSGNKVECTTTQINPDSSVYLSDCKVNNREVSNYSYGKDKQPKAFQFGDTVTYNNIDFYVLKDSPINDDTVILLKATPLTFDEVNTYGVGHINNNSCKSSDAVCYKKPVSMGGYPSIAYYSSETCGIDSNGNTVNSGCTVDYEKSDIKYIVDAWVNGEIGNSNIKEARLTKYDELLNFTEKKQKCNPKCHDDDFLKYDWLKGNAYWTMSAYDNSNTDVVRVASDGGFWYYVVSGAGYNFGTVRPVVELYKSALN